MSTYLYVELQHNAQHSQPGPASAATMTGTQKPIRLPPLKVLRVKNPNQQGERPCMALMSSVLACWASSGYNTAGCAQIEQALRGCMDAPPAPPPKRSEINYHLSRFQSRVSGTKKK